MQWIILNGARLVSREQAHAYLKEKLALPAYYGANLDALYDLLTDTAEPKNILLINSKLLQENLGPYGQELLKTFQEAALANQKLHFYAV